MTSESQNIQYQVKLNPSEFPPSVEPLFTAIGRAIFSWGVFETQLDFGLMTILQLPSAEPIRPKLKSSEPIPVAFKQKVKIWRKTFRNIPELEKYQDSGLELIDRAKLLAGRRDAIVHGNWNDFRDEEPVYLVGLHFRLRGDKVYASMHEANENGFNELADAMRDLANQMAKFLGLIYRDLKRAGVGKYQQ